MQSLQFQEGNGALKTQTRLFKAFFLVPTEKMFQLVIDMGKGATKTKDRLKALQSKGARKVQHWPKAGKRNDIFLPFSFTSTSVFSFTSCNRLKQMCRQNEQSKDFSAFTLDIHIGAMPCLHWCRFSLFMIR